MRTAADPYAAELRAQGHGAAVDTLLRDRDDHVTFSHYPQEHRPHPQTSTPLESMVSGVRLRHRENPL